VRLALLSLVLFFASSALLQATPSPGRMQVGAREYWFQLSRQHLQAGTAIVEMVNLGEDPHDLRLQRAGSRHIAGLGLVTPGEHAELTLRLPPGRYSLWCSVGDHRARGMRATLIVSR
jgi:plastocyanin